MATPTHDDVVLFLHAPDTVHWATFIAGRLARHQIVCTPQDLMEAADKENGLDIYCNNVDTPNASLVNRHTNSSTDSNDKNNNRRDSGRSSSGPANKALVIALSPDVIENISSFPLDVAMLEPKRSVFLFLGVDFEEARNYFGEASKFAFNCRMCHVDGSETSVQDAMVQIIEACEDHGSTVGDDEDDKEDTYDHFPSSKQKNSIQKVFPRELSETERDVYIFLDRPAEDDVTAVLDNSSVTSEVVLKCVCDRLYTFTVPDNMAGEIAFKIECQDIEWGSETVRVLTKLDKITDILQQEADPMTLLAKAMGLDSNDLGGVDTALGFRLQQLAPIMTFKALFPCEEALGDTEVQQNTTFPTLLHFAAEYNLRTFCSELLKFPGMLNAACTENKDGEDPRQIANRKGYLQLEHDLIQFVTDQKAADDSTYVAPPMVRKPPTAPKPHKHVTLPSSRGYVNDGPANDFYMDMKSLQSQKMPMLDLHSVNSEPELVSPVSRGSDSVFKADNNDDDNDEDSLYQNASEILDSPRLGSESGSSLVGSVSSEQNLTPSDSPRDGASSPGRKACKLLGVTEEELTKARSSTFDLGGRDSSISPPRGQIKKFSSSTPGYKIQDLDALSVSSNCDEPQYRLSPTESPKSRGKLKNFFGKIIHGKSSRSNSEGEITPLGSRPIKKSGSSRSSNSSYGSREQGSRKKKAYSTAEDPTERDSGSYSDEDKDKAGALPKKGKQKVFKEREKPMARKMSKRAQAALKETVEDAPTLPMRPVSTVGKKKGAFKSFVDDQNVY